MGHKGPNSAVKSYMHLTEVVLAQNLTNRLGGVPGRWACPGALAPRSSFRAFVVPAFVVQRAGARAGERRARGRPAFALKLDRVPEARPGSASSGLGMKGHYSNYCVELACSAHPWRTFVLRSAKTHNYLLCNMIWCRCRRGHSFKTVDWIRPKTDLT